MNSRYDRKIDSEHFNPNLSQEKLLMQIKPGSWVLECGCATGYMTRYMRDELGCHVSIVEYDAGAYEVARQYAEDGICADLMQKEWLDKFQGKQFDYILFADVLEHLYDPEVVLKSAVSLLKEDGTVLVSVPNIAHGDVLLNLWRGNWNYTEIGLLDKTHIRFFAEENLDDFFQKAGLSIVCLDCTIHPIGQTEQTFGLQGVADSELSFLDMIRKKEEATIYQFIITAQSIGYVQEHHIKKKRIVPSNKTMATLYYSQGEGFSEERVKRIYYSTPNFYQRFEWKRDFPKALRFDPVEGQACIVTAIQVLSSSGELEIVPINGYRLEHTDFFVTGDPQYSISVRDLCVEWIEIHAQIEVLSNGQTQAGIAELVRNCVRLEEIQGESLNIQRALSIKEEQLQAVNEAKKQVETILHITQKALDTKEEQLQAVNKAKQQTETTLQITQEALNIKEEQFQAADIVRVEAEASLKKALEDLKKISVEYHHLECSIAEMRESKSWKMTKPFRLLRAYIVQWRCNYKLRKNRP